MNRERKGKKEEWHIRCTCSVDLLQKLFGEPWLHGESVRFRIRKERLRSRLFPGRWPTTATDPMDGLGINADGKSLTEQLICTAARQLARILDL